MKSLYSILGVRPDATPDQIEVAYAEHLSKLQEKDNAIQDVDKKIMLVAIKEAYSVLSDPVARQRYNNKLFASNSGTTSEPRSVYVEEPSTGFGAKKILLVGSILLAGMGMYTYNAQQREQARIQHEKEIQLKALQLEEERQRRLAEEQEARLARQAQFDTEARERAQRMEQERFVREFESKQRAQVREDEIRMRQERSEKQRIAREEEMQRRRDMAEAQNRVRNDKMELQQIERERYGRVITR